MKVLFRPYEYTNITDGKRGQIKILLAVEFGPEAQEVYRLSFSSSCADALMRRARDAIIDREWIGYNSSYEGGFDLSKGSGRALRGWDLKWRKHVEIQGDTYSMGVGGYGLDAELIPPRSSHWIYWKPELLTSAQIKAITETQNEFLRRLRVYEGFLSMGLKMLHSPGRFDTCEKLLDSIFAQQTAHPWAFEFMEWAGGRKYKP